MASAAKVYAEQLIPRGHGLPLWEPEPGELGEIHIGDVGFVDEGGFCRLFNATCAEDDPLNAFGVPQDFALLEFNKRALLHTSADYVLPGPIYSSSIKHFSTGGGVSVQGIGASYKFSCTSNQGALVVLGDHGTRSLVRKNTVFERYMRMHRDSWLDFARSLGHDVDADDIILVSGWVKTSQWALAACTNYGRAHEVSLDATVPTIAGAKFEIKLCQDVEMSVDQRSGPSSSRSKAVAHDGLPRNQCLFVRYYKMKRTRFGVKKIVAAAGPQRCSSYDESERHSRPGVLAGERRTEGTPQQNTHDGTFDGRGQADEGAASEYDTDGEIQEEPCAFPYIDPLDVLLDYILSHSTAQIAVTCHEDLYSICSGDWPINLSVFLESASPAISVDDSYVGTIRHHGEDVHTLSDMHEVRSVLRDSSSPVQPCLHQRVDGSDTNVKANVDYSISTEKSYLPADGRSGCMSDYEDLPSDATIGYGDIEEDKSDPEDTLALEDNERPCLVTLVLHRIGQTHTRRHPHPYRQHNPDRRRCRDPLWLFTCISSQSAWQTDLGAPQPKELKKAPAPDKFAPQVIAAAPLAHIFLYRSYMKFAPRPHLLAAHVSAGMAAGMAAGVMAYGKRKRKPLNNAYAL